MQGAVRASPIVVAYFAYALTFGILAVQAGIPAWVTVLMSAAVFAGSSQFVALQLLALGSGIFEIMIATFFINLRHLLLSTSLAHKLPSCSPWLLGYLGYSNTDETYGVNMAKCPRHGQIRPITALGTNVTGHAAWALSTLVGVVIGAKIQRVEVLTGILPMMFAVLLGLQIEQWREALLAVLCGLVTVGMLQILPGYLAIVVVAVVMPMVGMILVPQAVDGAPHVEGMS